MRKLRLFFWGKKTHIFYLLHYFKGKTSTNNTGGIGQMLYGPVGFLNEKKQAMILFLAFEGEEDVLLFFLYVCSLFSFCCYL